jgi:hypothetical protein
MVVTVLISNQNLKAKSHPPATVATNLTIYFTNFASADFTESQKKV